ncbi:MAG: hypothetical protein Fur0042_20840 [Cyanophyceae cyanobacterium]
MENPADAANHDALPPSNPEDIERLRYTHALLIDWVKTADSKAQATVGLAAAMVSVLAFIKPEEAAANARLFTVVSLICVILSAVSWLFSGLAFFPRTKPTFSKTLLFFGDISDQVSLRSLDAGLDYLHQIKHQDFGRDLSRQIVVNAHICRQKYQWVSRAMVVVFASMFFFFLAIIVRVVN